MSNFFRVDILLIANKTLIANQWILYYAFISYFDISENNTVAYFSFLANLDISPNDTFLDDSPFSNIDVLQVLFKQSNIAFFNLIDVLRDRKEIWHIVWRNLENSATWLLLELLTFKIGSHICLESVDSHVLICT